MFIIINGCLCFMNIFFVSVLLPRLKKLREFLFYDAREFYEGTSRLVEVLVH